MANRIRSSLRDGEPCGHYGCLSHISHPCEGCGRIGGKVEYLAGKVIKVEPDTFNVQVKRHNGEELGPMVSSVFVFHVPDHKFQLGDFVGVTITKYGHINDRPDTIGEPEKETQNPNSDWENRSGVGLPRRFA